MSCAWEKDEDVRALLDPYEEVVLTFIIDDQGKEVMRRKGPEPEPELPPEKFSERELFGLFAAAALPTVILITLWILKGWKP